MPELHGAPRESENNATGTFKHRPAVQIFVALDNGEQCCKKKKILI